MMNSTRTPLPRVLVGLPLVLLTLVGSACAGRKEPEPIPSQTSAQVSPQLEPPPQLPPPIRQVRPTRPTTVKVIDPGGDADSEPRSLYEASQRAKALKQSGVTTREPIAEINDENLHEYAEKAEIIMVEGEPAVPPPSSVPRDASAAPEGAQDTRDEQYWRNGALQIRMNWRRAFDRIAELELEAAALRQRFYAEDDPYLRDSQIKPDWDRVLDRLRQLRDRVGRYEQELELFLDEGRRAGAPPGWLSEGWELEPESDTSGDAETEPFSPHQPGEPQVPGEVIDP